MGICWGDEKNLMRNERGLLGSLAFHNNTPKKVVFCDKEVIIELKSVFL